MTQITHNESLLSPIAIFHYFIISTWPWISLERESCWIRSLWISSSQCHSIPVLVPPSKPPDTVKDFYDGQTYGPKKRVGIWKSMDAVPAEYIIFAQTFHLTMWLFQFMNGITLK